MDITQSITEAPLHLTFARHRSTDWEPQNFESPSPWIGKSRERTTPATEHVGSKSRTNCASPFHRTMEKWSDSLTHRIIEAFEHINCTEHLLQMTAVSFKIKLESFAFAVNAVHAAGEPMPIDLISVA
jgi:hypothetical protein